MNNYNAIGAPWAFGIDVSDCKTSRDVMKKAKLDFIVDKCPLVASMPFGANRNNIVNDLAGDFAKDGRIYRELCGYYATYRSDTAIPLGLVKEKYEVVQNSDAFNFFDDAIGKDKAVWNKVGVLNHGQTIYLSAKLPVETRVGDDLVDNYLVFTNSHDGSKSVNIMFTPLRVICTNMLSGAIEKASCYIRLKHTKSVRKRINRGAEILNAAIHYAKSAEELYNSLLKVKLNDTAVLQYICSLVLNSDEHNRLLDYDKEKGYIKLVNKDYRTLEVSNISTTKANKINAIFKYYNDGIGQKEIRGTAWGAYNAITGYYSNVKKNAGEKRIDSLLYGGDNDAINKALREVATFESVI